MVVACSGGADSTALLAATVHEGHKAGGTSPGSPSTTASRRARPRSPTQSWPGWRRSAPTRPSRCASPSQAAGLGPEAAAREARYAVLHEVAQRLSAAAVLLGHTRDDQAETVLLGLARGSGGRSLAGMRRSFDDYYRRPLLDVSRADTVTACQVEGLEIWDDPHNADPAYLRSRVRTRVLPLLEEELGPGVAAALARTADQLRVDAEHLDDLADRRRPGPGGPADRRRAGRSCPPPYAVGCSACWRSPPAPRRPRSSTSTSSPSTRC